MLSSPSAGDDRRVESVDRFVADYQAFERALRACYAAGGQVMASSAEAHAVANLGGLAGHQVFAAVASATRDISTAISSTASGHRALEALGRRLGMDVTAFGDAQKPPEERFFEQASATHPQAA